MRETKLLGGPGEKDELASKIPLFGIANGGQEPEMKGGDSQGMNIRG